MYLKLIICLVVAGVSLVASSDVYAKKERSVPVTTDSRIKTFIYNENEVFRVIVHYGYQASIEFAKNEQIETISVGDNFVWKITPVGTRLFLKPLETNIHTNMTVITDKRAYQFDLLSRDASEEVDEELIYVVKFYYPGAHYDRLKKKYQGSQ